MDVTALFKMTYGMYVVAAKDGGRDVGCVANSIIQVTSSPATLAVSLNKDNYTTSRVLETGAFTVSVLSEKAAAETIGVFGFNTGKDKDKFEGISHMVAESGIAVLNNGSCAFMDCRVIDKLDCSTHMIFIAEITDAKKLSDEPSMTYEYYHRVIKGKAPKNAPTYIESAPEPEKGKAYTCGICGHVFEGTAEEFEALPDSYECPICTAPKACFSLK